MRTAVVKWFDELPSTNAEAVRHTGDADDFTVYVTDNQTAGRGQRGNVWCSEPGANLTFSIILKPDGLRVDGQSVISVITALAATEYLKGRGLNAKIKWPNDIYVGDRKICGVLVENRLTGSYVSSSVVGIGLNVNQRVFPSELPNPTSVVNETGGEPYDLKKELELFLRNFGSLYDVIDDGRQVEAMYDRYEEKLYWRDEIHCFQELFHCDGGVTGEYDGRILGVDRRSFRLLVRKADGTVVDYGFKDIRYVQKFF